MLEGWYCRSMANQQAGENDDDSDDSQEDGQPSTNDQAVDSGSVDYKARYLLLKHKLKFLLYENEYFQDTLRFNQRRLLKISRDRAFLLDRLLQYEKPGNTSSEGEATDSSDDETPQVQPPTQKETIKKRKLEGKAATSSASVTGGATRGRKRKIPLNQGGHMQPTMSKQRKVQVQQQHPPPTTLPQQQQRFAPSTTTVTVSEQENREIQMTTAEITRQLQARKPSAMELMSVECTPTTVPATMLSDESPSKCFQIEQPQHYLDNASPSHVAAEECVAMEYIN